MKPDRIQQKGCLTLRLAQTEDFDAYYKNYCPLDWEVVRMTGSKPQFSAKEVEYFFNQAITDECFYLFLLVDEKGEVLGESVINEVDWDLKKANFRIALYRPMERGQGIGTWMVKATRDFAFEDLKLHRLELDVYSFNSKARRVYEKAGFKVEGVLKEAIQDGDQYADDILMAMLEDDFVQIKKQERAKNDLRN